MAQVVYDQHPLGDYLKDEAGEQASSMIMPGGDNPVASDAEPTTETGPGSHDVFEPLVSVLRRVSHTIMLLSRQTAHREFAERFTHAVVLSPLLIDTSTTNSAPLPHHPLTLPENEHESDTLVPIHAWPLAAGLLVIATLLAGGLTSACVIAVIAGLAHATNVAPEHHARRVLAVACGKLRSSGWLGEWEDDPAPVMLSALDRCVQATSAWDTVVTEAVALLESEERTLFYGSSPRAPSAATSALRIAITSELNTATNTTDTLRALFAPLTQPAALAPLAAMYAPPTSPPPVRVRSHARYASIGAGPRAMDASPSPSLPGSGSKRSTWGPGIGGGGAFSTRGNYGGNLGLGRRRTSASMRRSRLATPDRAMGVPLPVDEDEDLSRAASDAGEDSIRLAPLPKFASDSEAATAPKTPPRRTRHVQSPLSIGFGTPGAGTFGSAALSSIRRASHHNQVQTTSLATIRHSLNVARASRRHTAAHLMALRFTDGDGEYWEDVRSVMGLLSAGLEDAAARLNAAVESMKEGEAEGSVLGSEGVGAGPSLAGIVSPMSAGFAPTIPPRERFTMHVHELVSAAGRAKDLAGSIFSQSNGGGSVVDGDTSSPDTDAAPAFPLSIEEEESRLEAVRRELGTALRQLERARAVLRAQRVRKDVESGEAEAEDSDVPALDASPSSPATSEKMEFTPLDVETRRTLETAHVRPDDASAYLLLGTSAQHLPPPGIEQVFEAETEDVDVGMAAKRPRSMLSRAERIAAARAKRTVSSPLPGSSKSGENWGPGGEVVQELKAVISEVGVRRRRAAATDLQTRPQVPVRGVLPNLDLSLAAGLSPPVEIEGERL